MPINLKVILCICLNSFLAFGFLYFTVYSNIFHGNDRFTSNLLILHNLILIFELKWIFRNEFSITYQKAFLTANLLHILTPVFLILIISILYQQSFSIWFMFSSHFIKWYILNAIVSGIYAFIFMKNKTKGSLSQEDILDEEFFD